MAVMVLAVRSRSSIGGTGCYTMAGVECCAMKNNNLRINSFPFTVRPLRDKEGGGS